MMINALRNPTSCAMKPIEGGPTKNPVKPTLLTADRAAEGAISLVFAASIYTIGITDDAPNPTNPNPMITVAGYVIARDNIIPARINKPFVLRTVE